jgi:hypothetical protein
MRRPNVKRSIIIVALLISGSAQAEMCDFEHKCFPDQPYYDLKGNRIPPPTPQYSQPKSLPTPQVTINSNVCKLVKIKTAPEAPTQIVEICTMSDEEERMYRQRQRDHQVSIPQMYMRNYLVPPEGNY